MRVRELLQANSLEMNKADERERKKNVVKNDENTKQEAEAGEEEGKERGGKGREREGERRAEDEDGRRKGSSFQVCSVAR